MTDKGLSGPMGFLSNWISKIGSKPEQYDTAKDYLMQGFKGEELENLDEFAKKKKLEKEKLQDYIIINPKSHEHSSAKIFLNKAMISAFLLGDYKQFFKTENFQRQYSFELPSILWRFERQRHIGDYVMIFPNPDYSNHKFKKPAETLTNNFITLPKAKRIVEQLLDTQLEFPQRRKFLSTLKEAFLESFMKLQDFKSQQSQNRLAQVLEGGQDDLDKLQKQKMQDEYFEESPVNRGRKKINFDESDPFARKNEEADEPLNLKKNTKPVDAENVENREASKVESKQDNLQKSKTLNNQNQPQKEGKATQEKDSSDEKAIKKILYGGDFYRRISDPSGEKDKCSWIRTKNQTQDFSTLIRQIVYTMIASQGLVTREFISQDGAFIVLVIYCPEENLKKIAEKIQLNKLLDITITDFMSFEPIDFRYRPIRTNEALWNTQKWAENFKHQVSKDASAKELEELEDMRNDIISLIEDKIQFKKIVRDINGIWDRSDNISNVESTVYDHDRIPFAIWENYYEYLKILAQKVEVIRQFHQEILLKLLTDEKDPNTVIMNSNSLKGKQDKIRIIKILSVLYRNAMIDSLNEVNDKITKKVIPHKNNQAQYQQAHLHNLWNELQVPPFEMSTEFILSTNKNRPRIRKFLDIIWKDFYTLNGEKSHFTQIERLKCCNWLLSKLLDLNTINDMAESIGKKIPNFSKHLEAIEDNFFPLHDNYLLQGQSPEKIFGSIFEYKNFYDKEEVKEIKVRGKFLKKYDENDENLGEKSQARGTKASKAGLSMMSEKRPFGGEFKLEKTGFDLGDTPQKESTAFRLNTNNLPLKVVEEEDRHLLNRNKAQIEKSITLKTQEEQKLGFVFKVNTDAKVPIENSNIKAERTSLKDLIRQRDYLNQKFLAYRSKFNDPLSFYEKIIYCNLRLDDKKFNSYLLETNDNQNLDTVPQNPSSLNTKKTNSDSEQHDKILPSQTKTLNKNYIPTARWSVSQHITTNVVAP